MPPLEEDWWEGEERGRDAPSSVFCVGGVVLGLPLLAPLVRGGRGEERTRGPFLCPSLSLRLRVRVWRALRAVCALVVAAFAAVPEAVAGRRREVPCACAGGGCGAVVTDCLVPYFLILFLLIVLFLVLSVQEYVRKENEEMTD